VRQTLKLAAISVAVIVNLGAAFAQNTPTPKPEDAERNAFETPTAGKAATTSPKVTRIGSPMPIRKAG
jgi:surface antigen